MSDNKNSNCVCKGIRKCGICAPDLVTQELDTEKTSLVNLDNLFVYCVKCDQSVKVDKSSGQSLNDYLDQKVSKIPCICQKTDSNHILKISGIFLQENFISFDEEQYLLSEIDKTKWIESQSGRFKQDFGPKANFKQKKIKYSTFTGLPAYSKFLIERIQKCSNKKIENFIPVELCNLKYESSRGACIDPHIDDIWLWGERLITLNLLENTFLTLSPGKQVDESYCDFQVLLPLSRFSMVVLTNDARFKWMHGIKKSHIKKCRQAITIRELTDEFKTDKNQGDWLEKLALTFKGVSIGTVEEFFNNHNKTENLPNQLWLDEQCLEKIKFYLEKLKIYINESSTCEVNDFYYKIGCKLAEWSIEHQKILPEIFNDEIQKSLTHRSIHNFCLISTDFCGYCNLMRDFFTKNALEPSLKSKIISNVYQIQEYIKAARLSDSFELASDWSNIGLDEPVGCLDIKTRKMFISLKFNNLAQLLSKVILSQLFDMAKIRPIIEKLISGYSAEVLLKQEQLNFINSLTFLDIVFNLPDQIVLPQVEKFYLINF